MTCDDLPRDPGGMSLVSPSVEGSLHAGVSWLASAQASSGEFPSFSSSLLGEPTWEPDRLNFVTALTSLALEDVDLPAVRVMRARVATYLRGEREGAGLWRYWASQAALHDYTPPDADDTACCSLALGDGSTANVPLLLSNRDAAGRFYTWMLLRPHIRSPRYRWALRRERSATVRARREELWTNSEASPDDVDVTVNANVIRYLGPALAPSDAVEWVASVVEAGQEVEQDHWYRSRTSLYRSVAIAAAAGVERFAGLRDLIVRRIVHDPGPTSFRNDLELADALRVLRVFGAPESDIAHLVGSLLERQQPDGSWERSICYYGGPMESFGWASEALATAAAVGALNGVTS